MNVSNCIQWELKVPDSILAYSINNSGLISKKLLNITVWHLLIDIIVSLESLELNIMPQHQLQFLFNFPYLEAILICFQQSSYF